MTLLGALEKKRFGVTWQLTLDVSNHKAQALLDFMAFWRGKFGICQEEGYICFILVQYTYIAIYGPL